MHFRPVLWTETYSVEYIAQRKNIKKLHIMFKELTLHFMSCTCKGYTTTPEIKAIGSNVKLKAFNDEERENVSE